MSYDSQQQHYDQQGYPWQQQVQLPSLTNNPLLLELDDLPAPPPPPAAPALATIVKPKAATRGKGKKQKEAALLLEQQNAAAAAGSYNSYNLPTSSNDLVNSPSGSAVDPNIIRSGRACLACRKLKTRCDGADEPPCKRCRSGNHECIFVESKRGKRPARKPTDMTLGEKFRSVEKTLADLVASVNTGSAPSPAVISQLQSTISEGIASTAGKAAKKAALANNRHEADSPASMSSGNSEPGGSSVYTTTEGTGLGLSNKRPRLDGCGHNSTSSLNTNNLHGRPLAGSISYESPRSANAGLLSPHLAAMLQQQDDGNSPRPSTSSSTSHHLPSITTPASTSGINSLSLLAEASLAAEIDGRAQLTGLDPSFRLSTVTALLQSDITEGTELSDKTPGLLTLGIVDAQTAVELFRIFFDYAYIHLPLLDPTYNTATAVCARSPFLFTVICAVASRFHADPTLHVKCYDEAHACFVECVANSERNIEMVQACLILTVWTNAPKNTEDRPQRAWLYFGMAVRMGLELGLFRPPAFVDDHLVSNSNKANPWVNLKNVAESEQREALNRERTWLMVFVIDRNMSAVMGRPYQIHEAKPLLIPLHPMSLPFDLGIIAHQELQSIIGQVMDTFRDRIYGLSSASDEMPSPVVLKLFNSRMDEWRQRWCPVAGEPIANNLLFYFYSSKLFLNTFPLHTMLRNGDAVDDPACVSMTINSAKAILDLGHKYAELGVLRHCPDVNFLLLLYAAVFLIKVSASNSRFAQLVDSEELQALMLQSIADCNAATCSSKHAASTCMIMLRALFASWKAMTSHNGANANGTYSNGGGHSRKTSTAGMELDHHHHAALLMRGMATDGSSDPFASTSTGIHGTLSGSIPIPTSPSPFNTYYSNNASNPFSSQSRGNGSMSGTQTPSHYANHHPSSSFPQPGDPLDSFLNDTHFFNSVLVSQGADGFFSWTDGLDSAVGMEAVGVERDKEVGRRPGGMSRQSSSGGVSFAKGF